MSNVAISSNSPDEFVDGGGEDRHAPESACATNLPRNAFDWAPRSFFRNADDALIEQSHCSLLFRNLVDCAAQRTSSRQYPTAMAQHPGISCAAGVLMG